MWGFGPSSAVESRSSAQSFYDGGDGAPSADHVPRTRAEAATTKGAKGSCPGSRRQRGRGEHGGRAQKPASTAVVGCEQSVGGLEVGVAFSGELENRRRWGDLGFWRLQDRIPARRPHGRRGLAEIGPNEILAGRHQAVALIHPDPERLMLGGQVADPDGRL
jgi:hypothetical protein